MCGADAALSRSLSPRFAWTQSQRRDDAAQLSWWEPAEPVCAPPWVSRSRASRRPASPSCSPRARTRVRFPSSLCAARSLSPCGNAELTRTLRWFFAGTLFSFSPTVGAFPPLTPAAPPSRRLATRKGKRLTHVQPRREASTPPSARIRTTGGTFPTPTATWARRAAKSAPAPTLGDASELTPHPPPSNLETLNLENHGMRRNE